MGIGAAAGAAAVIVSMPLDVIKTRMQVRCCAVAAGLPQGCRRAAANAAAGLPPLPCQHVLYVSPGLLYCYAAFWHTTHLDQWL